MEALAPAPPSLHADLFLILARGLSGQAALALRRAAPPEAMEALDAPALARWAGPALAMARGPIRWPSRAEVEAAARGLASLSICAAWRGQPAYPARLADALGDKSPAWLLLSSPPAFPARRSCAVIGSRQTSPRLCAATRALARSLADRSCLVVSGMAEGADQAAHEGAAAGKARALGVPARGLLQLPRSFYLSRPAGLSLLGVARPDEPFSAGLAIRRNDIIAALSDGVVMAASGLRGGSAYAVRWALRQGRPVWCFECGAHTPAGNKSLLRSGAARPLSLRRPPEEWADSILEEFSRAKLSQPAIKPLAQLDWLRGA